MDRLPAGKKSPPFCHQLRLVLTIHADLIQTWHAYRTWALVAVVAVACLLRLAVEVGRRRRQQNLSTSPPGPSSAAVKNDSDAKRGLLDDATKAPLLDGNDARDVSVVRPAKSAASKGPRRIRGANSSKATLITSSRDNPPSRIQPLVFFFSLGGATQKAAEKLAEDVEAWSASISLDASTRPLKPQVHDLSYVDYDDFFITPPKSEEDVKYFYLVILPTYNIDSVLHNFLEHMQETHHDFRIETAPLSSISGYSVFGFGDQEGWPTEGEGFCSQAKEVDMWMAKLSGRRRAFPLGMGDVKSDADERFKEWRLGVQDVLKDIMDGKGLGDGVPGSGDAVESDEGSADELDDEADRPREKISRNGNWKRKPRIDDLEDLGRMLNRSKSKDQAGGPLVVDFTTRGGSMESPSAALKEMVPKTSPTYASLTKQGYTIVGSHSGVKICRWTKSALRGRGSCYKFSFYGIKSHLCMETTPSLSCSNKCVFCWRHGTNPVGTTWRWQVDPPEMIFEGVKEGHYKKIKMLKGVPGVRAERFAEAMRIRHCALSLVGEPIFYPHINEFVGMLHKERVSSFLVCNAQHPDQLAALTHVTQLYVSIDASNKESLRKIDRPLHRDFWERFQRCLDILRDRRFTQRTVFRLTLVKGFNVDDEVKGYADLVQRGLPCFVEIKGFTYCGTSTSSAAGLTMQNVPFYHEVCDFVTALTAELQVRELGYGIAAEHAHSCCVLVASERFRIDGKWHTLIGYDKFFDCLESGVEFGPEDYVGEPTPEWALWGNGGFDPRDDRVDRKGRKKEAVQSRAVEIT